MIDVFEACASISRPDAAVKCATPKDEVLVSGLECPRCGEKMLEIQHFNGIYPVFCQRGECFSVYDCTSIEEAKATYDAFMSSSESAQDIYKAHRSEDRQR